MDVSSGSGIWGRLGHVLLWVLLATAGAFGLCFLWISLRRIGYPFELEWLEGDLFHHALRIHDGLAWYPAPSLDFFPEFYTPGYPALCALLMFAFGPNLALMRGVSLVSSLGVATLVVVASRRGGESTRAGLVAAGLFLATFAVCGQWFDLARVDMLAIGLTLAGVLLADRNATPLRFYLGIAVLALAVLVKQNHLAFLVATLLAWLFWDRKRGLLGALLGLVVVGSLVWALQISSHGWFAFYVFELPRAAPRVLGKAGDFLTHWIPSVFGLAVLPVAAAYWKGITRSLPLLLVPIALLVSISGWIQRGGYLNNAIPAVVFVSVAIGIGLGRLVQPAPRFAPLPPLAMALLLGQFIALRYPVAPCLPTEQDLARGTKAVARVAALPGPVLAPYHPYLLHLAGRPMGMQFHMYNEYLQAKQSVSGLDAGGLDAELASAVAARRWGSYLGIEAPDFGVDTPIDRLVAAAYTPIGPLIRPDDKRTLFPVTGNRVRPGSISILASTGGVP